MNKKLIVQLAILGMLILYTMIAWSSSKRDQRDAEKATEENLEEEYITGISSEDGQTADSMMKVGVPLMITVIYGGVLAVIYVLPMFVDRMSEELMGSTEEVGDDPLVEARAAVSEENYPEAIRIYREIWREDSSGRFPMVEIARIQRDKLESPAVAVMTLEEALEEHEWEEEDASFLIFRMIEIYDKDLDDKESVVRMLKRAVEELPGTRHAANATHQLRELGAI
ncbi:MAG: hypothetical protein QNL33_02380 [Akkermansiaceae bacterium]|jgi:hypothetical protein